MADKLSFRFMGIRAEAEGIKTVKIAAMVIGATLFTLIAITAIWAIRLIG